MDIVLLHQDEHFAAVNKPSGIAVNADVHSDECYWDQLKAHFAPQEIFKVHRLDKGTSGLMLVAFSEKVQQELQRQFRERTVEKQYIAQCVGVPDPSVGVIDAAISQGRGRKFRVAGPDSGKKSYPSRTSYTVLSSNEGRSIVLVKPQTGRTHQIRVHFAHIGHPLVGDTLYGKPWHPGQKADRLMLHSHRLAFTLYGKLYEITTPAPFMRDDTSPQQ